MSLVVAAAGIGLRCAHVRDKRGGFPSTFTDAKVSPLSPALVLHTRYAFRHATASCAASSRSALRFHEVLASLDC